MHKSELVNESTVSEGFIHEIPWIMVGSEDIPEQDILGTGEDDPFG